jgi:hypothetical protein
MYIHTYSKNLMPTKETKEPTWPGAGVVRFVAATGASPGIKALGFTSGVFHVEYFGCSWVGEGDVMGRQVLPRVEYLGISARFSSGV